MTRDDLILLIELYLYEAGILDPDRRTKLAQEIVTSLQDKRATSQPNGEHS